MRIDKKKLIVFMAMACLGVNELCKKAGIGTATLNQITKGQRNAKPKTIGKLARALGVDVTDLIDQEV